MAAVETGLIVTIVLLLVALSIYWKLTYWKRKKVPYLLPELSLEKIKNPSIRKQSLAEWSEIQYKRFKRLGVQHVGLYIFSLPTYLPISPQIIKNIMQTDFQYFVNRGVYYNEKDDPLSAHLFAIGGQKWRNLRTKLTPTFTSGKLKSMFSTLINCTKPMEENMATLCLNNQPVLIRDVVARFSTDVIGSCAFGLECESFKSRDAPFRYHGQKVFTKIEGGAYKRLLAFVKPKWARKLSISLLPKDSTEFFRNVIKDTIKYRQENNILRQDMLQLLMGLQNDSYNKDCDKNCNSGLTIEEIAAQAFVFFLAGFETSSTTMTFCLYELALHLDIQNKVRDEIRNVLRKYNGELTYDAVMDLKYMNQVIEETLRKYPALPTVTRQCVKDYQVPGTNIIIEKGTKILIPILALHRDPMYFKDPEKFDPERFSEQNKVNIHPFTYMPFGEGPRLCIGMRFGMVQTKVGLTCLLANYSFTVNSKTESIVFHKYSVVLKTEKPIWFNIQKLE